MCSYLAGLKALILAQGFIYIHTLCVPAVKVMGKLVPKSYPVYPDVKMIKNPIVWQRKADYSTEMENNGEHPNDHVCEALTLCLPGIFYAFLSSDFFSKINLLEKFFQEYHQSIKQFGSRSGPTVCDLGPNCLQKLSADDTSR